MSTPENNQGGPPEEGSQISGPERPRETTAWRRWLSRQWSRVAHPLLFILTVLTTFSIGLGSAASFETLVTGDATLESAGFSAWLASPHLVWAAFVYTAALLGFLTAHEMGHYLSCRFYGIKATLPYYLPNPLIFGTFGAVIRIKSPIRNKKQLFDIGIAGPLAGFVVAVPLLFVGLHQSLLIPNSGIPDIAGGSDSLIILGEPLLHQLFAAWIYPVEGNYTLIMSPLGMVGWFACLVTSINLLPVSQLDGGHILYALFGKAHYWISLAIVALVADLAVYTEYWGWLVWIGLILFFRLRHPPLLDEHVQLGVKRRITAVLALIVFILSFMPVPIDVSL